MDKQKKNINDNYKLLKVIFFGLCPSCGRQNLFSKYIFLNKQCSNCYYSIKNEDIGDAASWFSMLITSLVVSVGVLFVEIKFSPSLWVHMVTWFPLVILIAIIVLRPIKLIFIYLNFKRRN